jgi:hypothetical protein
MLKRVAIMVLGVGLIGLGTLFFFSPQDSRASQFLMFLWPVFLVFAGIVRLVGYFIDRHPRSPMEGLLLAAAGGICLSANFLRHHSLLLLIQKYWFWLLLAYLTGRLMKQYLYLRSDGPIRPRAFTPGSLLIMLLIVGGGLSASYAQKVGKRFEAQFDKESIFSRLLFSADIAFQESSNRSFSVPEHGNLILESIPGNLEVSTAPQSDGVAQITRRIRAVNSQQAREQTEKVSLDISSTENDLTFRVNGGALGTDVETDLLITLPQRDLSNILIRNPLGNIRLRGLRGETISISGAQHHTEVIDFPGDVKIEIQNGRLFARNIAGSVEVRAINSLLAISDIGDSEDTNTGGLTLSDASNCQVSLSRVSGAINIQADHSLIKANSLYTQAALQIKADNGSVEASDIQGPAEILATEDIKIRNFTGPLTASTLNGDITLNTNRKLDADLKLSSDQGRIRLQIPIDTEFQLDASALKGRIRLDGFPGFQSKREDETLFTGYHLTENSPLIDICTRKGDILLKSYGLAIEGDEKIPLQSSIRRS